MKIHHTKDIAKLRAAEYPDMGDQLDAVMKGFAAAQVGGMVLPDETKAWIDACQQVKKKYPKPT
jgi:predicted transcriptional regulator